MSVRSIPWMRYKSKADGPTEFLNNPLREIWSISPSSAILLIIVTLLDYSLRLVVPLLIATIVQSLEQARFEHLIWWLGQLGIASIALLLSALADLWLQNRVALLLCQKLERLMSTQGVDARHLSALEAILMRDVTYVLDEIPKTTALVSLPIFLAASTALFCWYLGAVGGYALLLLASVVPMCYWLGKAGAANFESVMRHTTRRIERCSHWIKVGPKLRQFGQHEDLQSIHTNMEKELIKRDHDSMYRGLDAYLVGFGRLMPAIVMGVVGSTALGPDGGMLVWLSMPLLAALLNLPRCYVSFRSTRLCLRKLNQLLPSRKRCDTSTQHLATERYFPFDEGWPIWPGRLCALLPSVSDTDNNELARLASELQLVPELGGDLEALMAKTIDVDARNISSGQRCRLQLMRGLLIAKHSGWRMVVDSELPSLNGDLKGQVLLALSRYEKQVRLGPCAGSPASHCAMPEPDKAQGLLSRTADPMISKSGLVTTLCHSFPGMILFTLPAAMLAFSVSLVDDESSSPLALLAYATVGIALGALIGLSVERRVRERYKGKFIDRMQCLQENMPSFSLHVASRDMTTIFERIAWYSHDIAWTGGLLFISSFLLVTTFGMVGVGIASLMLLALLILYASFIERLTRTRIEAVLGIDALINMARVVFSVKESRQTALSLPINWLDSISRSAVARDIGLFFETRAQSLAARTIAVALGGLILRTTMLIVILGCLLLKVDSSQIIIAVSALLFLQADFSNAFLAATGMKSQAISVDRLEHFCQLRPPVSLDLAGASLTIGRVISDIEYRPLTLQFGRCYSLTGRSGIGKSIYLKTVADVISPRSTIESSPANANQIVRAPCYYIDAFVLYQHINHARSPFRDADPASALMRWIRGRCDGGEPVLFLLDEAFESMSQNDLAALFDALQETVTDTQATIILVEHRQSFPSTIELSSLIVPTASDH